MTPVTLVRSVTPSVTYSLTAFSFCNNRRGYESILEDVLRRVARMKHPNEKYGSKESHRRPQWDRK